MNEKKELSASALQILERKERIEAMWQLARDVTREQAKKLLEKFPKHTEAQITELVKKEGIPKFPFLHEYLIAKSTVRMDTAKDYFGSLANRLNPNFFEVRDKNEPRFHLSEEAIRSLVSELKKAPKGAKKP